MTTLKNSSLTLYAYQIAADTEHEQRADIQALWETLAKLCATTLKLADLAKFQSQFITEQQRDTAFLPLLGREQPSVGAENEQWQVNITPLRLHDLYAVDFSLSVSSSVEQPMGLEQLHTLNPQGCLLPTKINASLGQSLLLYLEPEDETTIDSATLPQYIEALWSDSGQPVPEFVIQAGQLFDSPFYDCLSVSATTDAPAVHLIVLVGTSEKTLELAGDFNYTLMALLAYRHKIDYVRGSAKRNYEAAREFERGLKDKNNTFATLQHDGKRLKILEGLLQSLPTEAKQFGDCLSALNDHQFTLKANLHNYQAQLNTLQTEAHTQSEVWQAFYTNANEIDAPQLALYQGYLAPTQSQFQTLTQNIQGLLQIDTLKHEFTKQERLELLVVFIATSLESAAISVKVNYSHHFAETLFNYFYPLYPIISGVIGKHLTEILAHVGVGLGFGGLALVILWMYQRSK